MSCELLIDEGETTERIISTFFLEPTDAIYTKANNLIITGVASVFPEEDLLPGESQDGFRKAGMLFLATRTGQNWHIDVIPTPLPRRPLGILETVFLYERNDRIHMVTKGEWGLTFLSFLESSPRKIEFEQEIAGFRGLHLLSLLTSGNFVGLLGYYDDAPRKGEKTDLDFFVYEYRGETLFRTELASTGHRTVSMEGLELRRARSVHEKLLASEWEASKALPSREVPSGLAWIGAAAQTDLDDEPRWPFIESWTSHSTHTGEVCEALKSEFFGNKDAVVCYRNGTWLKVQMLPKANQDGRVSDWFPVEMTLTTWSLSQKFTFAPQSPPIVLDAAYNERGFPVAVLAFEDGHLMIAGFEAPDSQLELEVSTASVPDGKVEGVVWFDKHVFIGGSTASGEVFVNAFDFYGRRVSDFTGEGGTKLAGWTGLKGTFESFVVLPETNELRLFARERQGRKVRSRGFALGPRGSSGWSIASLQKTTREFHYDRGWFSARIAEAPARKNVPQKMESLLADASSDLTILRTPHWARVANSQYLVQSKRPADLRRCDAKLAALFGR